MKVEELYAKGNYSQVGITLQRMPFETEVDVLPEVNPFEVEGSRGDTMAMMSDLTSSATEEMLKGVASYRRQDPDEEFLAIPLKRFDSGPQEHCMLERPSVSGGPARSSAHQALMDEIDDPVTADEEITAKRVVSNDALPDKAKDSKKSNTLSRMLKGMRIDKEQATDVQHSLSKIFQRINPVGKASRDNFNKALHRIGDALHKKGDDRERPQPPPPQVRATASATSRLIGGNNSFKFKSASKEAVRTTTPATHD